MRAHTLVAVAFALTALAACARDSTTSATSSAPAPVVSNDPPGTSMLTPQSPNSLPPGAAVNAPPTSPTGVVATTPTTGPRGTTRR